MLGKDEGSSEVLAHMSKKMSQAQSDRGVGEKSQNKKQAQ